MQGGLLINATAWMRYRPLPEVVAGTVGDNDESDDERHEDTSGRQKTGSAGD